MQTWIIWFVIIVLLILSQVKMYYKKGNRVIVFGPWYKIDIRHINGGANS